MQQFVIPQFIDVEDKIIGPITTRQFIIMLAGFIIIGISYKLFDFTLFIAFGVFIFIVSGIIAFLKINGRPFHYFILNLFQTFKRPKLRVWRVLLAAPDYGLEKKIYNQPVEPVKEKHYAASRLAELSLIVDTRGAYQGEKGQAMIKLERE